MLTKRNNHTIIHVDKRKIARIKLVTPKARQNHVFGEQKPLNRSLQNFACRPLPGAVQDVITPVNFGEDRSRGFGVARGRLLAFSIDLLRRL